MFVFAVFVFISLCSKLNLNQLEKKIGSYNIFYLLSSDGRNNIVSWSKGRRNTKVSTKVFYY